jgi:hypothetical protein
LNPGYPEYEAGVVITWQQKTKKGKRNKKRRGIESKTEKRERRQKKEGMTQIPLINFTLSGNNEHYHDSG